MIQGGIHDSNSYVKQVAIISLVKLFENTDIDFEDYADELEASIF